MTRLLRFVVHNWPLKVAAIALASVLYGGLVLSQTTKDFPGTVPIETVNQPSDVTYLNDLGSVSGIRYIAPQDLGLKVDSSTFSASVNLADVDPSAGPVTLRVHVTAADPRIQIVDFTPQLITVRLDLVTSRQVPVKVILGTIPSGVDVGVPVYDPATVTVRGADSIVSRVVEAQARVSIDPSGLDVNRLVDLVPVDDSGQQLQVDVNPTQARVKVPVFTNRQTKSLPVNPVVVGSPAAGFEVDTVSVSPQVVSVEGDANDLAQLDRADTAAVSITGASSEVQQTVGLDLPDGVQPLDPTAKVEVTITLRPVTGTRTFEAGLVLVGSQVDRTYALSTDRVLVTIGGPIADLDRLSGAQLTVNLDVTGLDVGSHLVPVTAKLNTGLILVSSSPDQVDVTITAPQSSPGPSPSGLPSASPAPTP
jgi:YbbR domain-containing protein